MADAPDAHSVPDLVRKIRALEPEEQQRLARGSRAGKGSGQSPKCSGPASGAFQPMPARRYKHSLDSHAD